MSLAASHVNLEYFDGDRKNYAVRDVTVQLPEAGYFGIMGPSGSGKSSLLYLLSGLKTPSSGSVTFGGVNLGGMREPDRARLRRDRFGFVFQQPFLLNYLTAKENILLAAGADDPNALAHVDALLDGLGIGHLAGRYPAHLSGGERQRLVVARAMVNRPSVIFADEPTAALDHSNGRAVVDLLSSYRGKGLVLVVSHDPAMLDGADGIYHMTDGQIDSMESGVKLHAASLTTGS